MGRLTKLHVLLVEDNEGDILLTTEALHEKQIVERLSVQKDGAAAIEFLQNAVAPHSNNIPDLILLDINLPKKNGHEVLQHIKSRDDLKQIPVVMLTTSSAESDIEKSYKNYANCYITKPVDIHGFLNVIENIESFWACIARLPKKL